MKWQTGHGHKIHHCSVTGEVDTGLLPRWWGLKMHYRNPTTERQLLMCLRHEQGSGKRPEFEIQNTIVS